MLSEVARLQDRVISASATDEGMLADVAILQEVTNVWVVGCASVK